jgi:hypothetical protein
MKHINNVSKNKGKMIYYEHKNSKKPETVKEKTIFERKRINCESS